MALIKCSECGKKISDKAVACPHCGCPVSEMKIIRGGVTTSFEEPINKNKSKVAKKEKKSLPFIIIGVIIVIAIIAILISSFAGGENGNVDSNEISEVTYGTITGGTEIELAIITDILYLSREDVISVFPNAQNEETKIIIPGTFAGSTGIYKAFFSFDGNHFDQVIFERDSDAYDSKEVVGELCEYLGDYVEYDTEWNKYEWVTDDLELSFYVDERIYFYETSSIIKSISNDINNQDNNFNLETDSDVLDKIKEVPNNITDEIEDLDEERVEADDYDEFKYAVDTCIQHVPDCMLDLDYTDNDTSYSINLDDEIIGILGTKIDSWDAVALVDPDKDDALLHHEQISIALIMACDTDITYEEAKKIFDEASEEGSARISSGIYFFEGMAEGMYAGGVDISWLD